MLTESIVRGLEKLGYTVREDWSSDWINITGERGESFVHIQQLRAINGGTLGIREVRITHPTKPDQLLRSPLLRDVLAAAK